MSAATGIELAERRLDECWEAKQAAERAVVAAQGVLWHAEQGLKQAIASRAEDHKALEEAHAAYMVEWEKDQATGGAIWAQITEGAE